MKSFKDIRTKLEETTLPPQEMTEASDDWVLGFEFEIEYTSREGRDIQDHLAKKFKKVYSGSGSGGAGFDVSFDGPKRELEKVKKYVEKKFSAIIDKKYTNFYQYEGYEVTDELVSLEEMSAKDHYRKVMRGGRGKGFVVSSPIDRERYPNREREGLEGPYKSRKSGKIFYYDRKEGKYYDPDSDMYLDVSDVMESVQIDEDEKTQRFFKEVHAELKKVMDDKYYREFRASNDGRALDNVINHFGKSRGFRVDKTVKSIIDKYGRNRDEFVKLSFQSAANTRRGFREEVEIHEKIDYKYTGTVVRIKRREFAKVHKDFKNDTPGKERMMVLDPKTGGTISVPVMFEETQLDETMSGDKLLGIFNKLKNKDTVEIKYDSGIRKGKDYQKFVVTSGKRTVGKARVERIILKSVDNPHGVKYTLYNRKGNVSLAIGDMAASIVDIKESINESVWRTPEERHQNYHELALGLIANIYGKDANMWREVVKDERWVDSFGDYVKAKINRGLDVDKPGTAGYMDQQGRGDWSFVIDTLTGVVKYTHNRKSGKFRSTVEFGKYIRSVRESVSIDEFELDETVSDKLYRASHGKKPNPNETGGWYFGFSTHPDDIVYQSPNKMKYKDAKIEAEKVAKKKGLKKVYVMASYNPEYDEELSKMNIGEGKAWDAITKVKDEHQSQKVHGMVVDAMTANLLHKVHDALNSTNQKKFVAAIDKNAAGLKKMVDFAYKQVK